MATEAIKKPAEYSDFLLSPIIQEQLGFHVNVGTPDTEVERIGCLRWMLIARSKVFRTMLLESELKVGKEMDITDLKPKTFKDFLTFIYGHDHTNGLQFGECIDLLAAADKYDVAELKSRLAALTTAQVTTDNVCTVLEHGPVCETVPELWEKTTEIIQSKTDVVFALPQFLTLSPSAVVHILQQDALSVMEIDVWRAGLNWAKAQLSCDDGMPSPELVRNTMDPLLRHTRLCTIRQLDIADEVVPSCILKPEEVMEIFVSIKNHVESNNLGNVCSDIKNRAVKRSMNQTSGCTEISINRYQSSSYEILTKQMQIKLLSGLIRTNQCNWSRPLPIGLTYKCEGNITIHKVDYSKNALYDLVYEIPFSETVEYVSDVELKMQTPSGSNVILEANSKYQIKVEFTVGHLMWVYDTTSPGWNKTHFDLSKFTVMQDASRCYQCHHINILKYQVLN